MNDFMSEQQCDELVDGQYYNGEYQPTEQDYRDMAEAWGLDANGGFGHHADESMCNDEETEDFEW